MFANDVTSLFDFVVRLQRLINLTEEFCKLIGMTINFEKTKTVFSEWRTALSYRKMLV